MTTTTMQPAATQAEIAAAAPRNLYQGGKVDAAKARETGKKFEAQFVSQMMSCMFTGLDQEKGLFGGGHAEAMFRPMLLDEYGKMVSNRGHGIGIADEVTRMLLKHQEV